MSEDTSDLVLVFGLAGRRCALPLVHVRETMRPLPVVPLDAMPAFVRGLSMVRGEPVPVVDATRLCGGRPAVAGRWIRVAAAGRAAVLEVDEVLGIHRLPPEARMPRPPLLDGADAAVVEALGRLDGELLLLLQTARLLPDAAWAAVEAAAPMEGSA